MTKDEAFAYEEDNIEDSGTVEQTEYIGNTQRPVKEIPQEVILNPIPIVEPVAVDENKKSIDNVLAGIRGTLLQVPGLDCDTLVNKFIDSNPALQKVVQVYEEIQANKDGLYSKEEVENAAKSIVNQKANMVLQYKDQFQESVDIIQACFTELKKGTQDLITTITTSIPLMAVPDVIVAGSATGVPNPVKENLKLKQLKSTVSVQLNQLTTSSITLLHEAGKVGFAVPEPVLAVIATLSTLSATISKIPV